MMRRSSAINQPINGFIESGTIWRRWTYLRSLSVRKSLFVSMGGVTI
ncbi:MAG TPA: hypothetical protein VFE36_08480 [Candidatus Baltobacteraceae bacterium]|nr:hypothetical protein [Candidatus Baltobacteraceae bacterium]